MQKRTYTKIIEDHFKENRQMLFLTGPRQVGKTTVSKELQKKFSNSIYLNWDDQDHKELILKGPSAIAEEAGLNRLGKKKTLFIFDEIHKYSHWKNFLKGFFDTYENKTSILVTGSSRLDVYRKGGDSLMGRYFILRMHPLSIAEIAGQNVNEDPTNQAKKIPQTKLQNLMDFGGFPEPYTKNKRTFYRRWSALKHSLLFKEDLRESTMIQDLGEIELLAELLRHQIGQQGNYSNLAKKIRKSVDTVRRWFEILQSFYYCYEIRPWAKNVTRSLLKEPKFYLWDWSLVEDEGARVENFIASHLLKAVHMWNDLGFGAYGLHYLRDKEKREVDFIITKNQKPWFLIEAKKSANKPISKGLVYFHKMLDTPHAFQVALDLPFVPDNCFEEKGPIKVPASTILSQLV
ncbi:MAG: putative AAA+ superfamily ATPase [Chlamydiales bacterium]|jgi:predicted AAA+ superfamily ATPase